MGDISKDIQMQFSNNKMKALLNIMYTASWISSRENAFFKPFGISPQQFNVLRILRGAGKPMAVQSIKERMIDRNPNTTRLMDKMCAKNLIERIACESDRRVVHIEITQKGLSLLQKIDDNKPLDWLKNLSDKEAALLSDLLDKIR
ncbi:MarR family winged helix-turn-helix transcriptional regulator [Ulvibacter litoralis]|uniref:DNA-binding transcriptional regulator, MarR family n=1 Tax=Ulvibacter litoralis TaxID=227084 RepID=A0A1G7I3X6_9FLAO|nr:MarR family transcriptional regulator [Ulvibacter litoralis]GHC62556.1 MarR family transcriptional regulator [Ulvibacter litoralis]SDF07487.1 DNA-binding transcriptional regulator, MarR family [Ulvibacter litoralis]